MQITKITLITYTIFFGQRVGGGAAS